jgi:hypothetical protein
MNSLFQRSTIAISRGKDLLAVNIGRYIKYNYKNFTIVSSAFLCLNIE